ncbi:MULTISPECIES: hypothetical protein [unclassified Vibrio]|jgi:hypothetical protein|uniref:hypothetical protein n=1 Tax=unclassified Vibrio TaxID=2614977 RepID=UPI000DF2A1BE|nr:MULTISPECIES: hypothetical protein [unclassified Vibrio]MCK8065728.1 hypothetical protein [Vibrio sp. 1CM7H]RCW19772.1 hypothetical protein DET53_11635 [Vibrio parahaemolyticus]HDU8579768.1 hypothetical protein [Vibrio diabolicus]
MNSDLKNNLIMALVGAILASAGFVAKGYFEAESEKEKFAFNLHKKLYDEGAASMAALNNAYSELYALYGEGYGLTPSELSEKHENLRNSLKDHSDYIGELERYGTTGQIEIAKNHFDWFWGVYSELDLQYKTANQVEKRAKELLLIEDVASEHFDFVDKALESEIERLVRNENRIFYSIGWYKKPVINGIEQYLNLQFREALGLPATKDMAEKINSLPELRQKSNNFEYKEKRLPFMFAEGRSFQAPTLEFQGDTDFFETKNDVLAANVKMKFIASAIENDKWLQEELKRRKTTAQKENES